ncbi:MAG: 2OG-Fe dioxygenase family protein [Arenicella sp.]|nr:2OG-Fe dioxygenase family protein [Arenicella sp.]
MNTIDMSPRIEILDESSKAVSEIQKDRYCFGNYVDDFAGKLDQTWDDFCSTWDDLGADSFMADEGSYRERRFSMAVYDAESSELSYKRHGCYFQKEGDNPLNGGVERKFDAITPYVAGHGIIKDLVRHYGTIFSVLGYGNHWDLQIHQVRIKTSNGETGEPSPEGIHKDGTNFTTLVLINRNGVIGGENMLFDNNKELLASKVLENQGDFVILNDKELYHDVSAIEPASESPGYRDMLMIGFTQI